MYFNDWEGTGIEGMMNDFQVSKEELENANILVATYSFAHYEGDAFVLFEEDGLLYEVNGGHCSCYGLENQWQPEETSPEAIKIRIESGWWERTHGEEFVNKLKEVLENYNGS